jgi:type IV pilus assembly protein PilE
MAVFGSRTESTVTTHCARGFTLLEVMIVVAIVAILAAIALPNYSEYIRRGKIIEATTALSDMRTRYEQFFLDHRKYTGGCASFLATVQPQAKSFTLECLTGETDTAYAPTATGIATEGMSGFTYTINQLNQRSSSGPGGTYTNGTCWANRKDGSCP